ncbi:MAG TPA: potassium channel family protein [Myxococcota bacterium]|nr:potassium channel family protein [Myxococcota bacterium]
MNAAPVPPARRRGGLDLATLLGMYLFASQGDSPLSWPKLKNSLRDAANKDPMESLLLTVAGGTLLFYYAERGHNERVRTPWDALEYISTALSVGYSQIFPVTAGGKAIASAVMTFGPALAAKALDAPPGDEPVVALTAEQLRVQKLILEKLEKLAAAAG